MALTDLFNDIADAIREKDGTTAEIVANTFPDRIRAIPTGIGGVQLESITIINPPNKIYYYAGDVFDPTGMTVRANYSNGQSLYVNLSNLTFSPSGPLTSDTTSITVNFQWGIKMVSASQPISVVTVMCFGVVWDYSDPSPELTRLTPDTDPNGYVTVSVNGDPSPAVGTGPGNSPFDGYMPWVGMEEYNFIDGAVGPKKGETGFSRNNDTAVYIPKFWYDVVDDPINNKRYWYISNVAYKNMGVHPGSNKYLARYKCGTEARSITGLDREASISVETAKTNCVAKGPGFDLSTQKVWSAVRILYLVEFATWDSQAAIGGGIYGTSNTVYVSAGLTDTMAYHTGKVSDDEWPQIQYRWIEGPYGNSIDFCGDLVSQNLQVSILENGVRSDPIYTLDSGISLGAIVTKLAFIPQHKWLFFPSAATSDETVRDGYLTDESYIYIASSELFIHVSDYYKRYRFGGMFVNYGAPQSYGGNNYGYRYIYSPSSE